MTVHPEERRDTSRASFLIRVIDWHSHYETKIDVLLPGNEPSQINVVSYNSSSESKVDELYEKAKLMIDFDGLINEALNSADEQETDILITPESAEKIS